MKKWTAALVCLLLVLVCAAASAEAKIDEKTFPDKQFRAFVEAQGGDPAITEDPSLFPQASVVLELKANGGGYVSALDAETVGRHPSFPAPAGQKRKTRWTWQRGSSSAKKPAIR